MLQGIKIETLSKSYQKRENAPSQSISWAKFFYVLQCIVLFALSIGAIALSIASDYLFLKEILSGTFLLVLLLFIKITGDRS